MAKILFIMQQVTPGTHMDYVFEMARTLKEEKGLLITLLLEKRSSDVSERSWVKTQHFSWPPLRTIENLFLILKERIKGTKIFYIHYSFLSAISAGMVTRLLGGKVYYWNAGMPWLYKRSWLEDTYQKIAYRLIHVLVTGAYALQAGYAQTYGLKPEQIMVIPNWIDLNDCKIDVSIRREVRIRYNIPQESPVILFVQKHATRKGAHLVPEIFSAIKDSKAHLLMAGNGPLHDQLKRDFVALGLSHRVHMVGNVTRDEISTFYQTTDVFLLPSEEEGSPHALIEAMAYGLPSVVSDVGGVSETMTEALMDWVVPYGNTNKFAEKVSTLLADRKLRSRVSKTLKEVAMNYDKSKIEDKFYNLLIQ